MTLSWFRRGARLRKNPDKRSLSSSGPASQQDSGLNIAASKNIKKEVGSDTFDLSSPRGFAGEGG